MNRPVDFEFIFTKSMPEAPVGAEFPQFAEFLHKLRLMCKKYRFFAEYLHQNYDKKKHCKEFNKWQYSIQWLISSEIRLPVCN